MWRVIVGTVGVVVPVTVTMLDVFGYVAKVEGASMQPVLNPKEEKGVDYVLLNRWQARNFKFERGEVVSLSSPTNPDQKIIKRIIGLEGDNIRTLSYKNRNVHVPEGHCWVEGDHHGQSLDSNYFGPVAMGLINAKASHIVWPPHRMGRLEGVIEQGDRVNGKPELQPGDKNTADNTSTEDKMSTKENSTSPAPHADNTHDTSVNGTSIKGAKSSKAIDITNRKTDSKCKS